MATMQFGCNCGKKGAPAIGNQHAQGKGWRLVLPNGDQSYHDTEQKARSANAAAGGRGIVRPVK